MKLGAKFAKWRAVITIGEAIPSHACLYANAHALARYAEAGTLRQEVPQLPYNEALAHVAAGALEAAIQASERAVSEALLVGYTGVQTPVPAEGTVSPNGDGVAESQQLAFKVVRPSSVTGSNGLPQANSARPPLQR